MRFRIGLEFAKPVQNRQLTCRNLVKGAPFRRAADEKRKAEAERREQGAVVPPSAVVL
jgi:hypothetical protein